MTDSPGDVKPEGEVGSDVEPIATGGTTQPAGPENELTPDVPAAGGADVAPDPVRVAAAQDKVEEATANVSPPVTGQPPTESTGAQGESLTDGLGSSKEATGTADPNSALHNPDSALNTTVQAPVAPDKKNVLTWAAEKLGIKRP